MAHVRAGKVRTLLRSAPSGAFDQYLLDIQKLPMISDPEEEKRLARRALAGDQEAAERLVTANLRFVISYVKRYQGHGLDLSELVAIGNEGLLKAVRKFDPDHGVKFISYAVWWVRQAVLKALAESEEFEALIAIGCVIRGETYHFELVANESGAGVSRVVRAPRSRPMIQAIR